MGVRFEVKRGKGKKRIGREEEKDWIDYGSIRLVEGHKTN